MKALILTTLLTIAALVPTLTWAGNSPVTGMNGGSGQNAMMGFNTPGSDKNQGGDNE